MLSFNEITLTETLKAMTLAGVDGTKVKVKKSGLIISNRRLTTLLNQMEELELIGEVFGKRFFKTYSYEELIILGKLKSEGKYYENSSN